MMKLLPSRLALLSLGLAALVRAPGAGHEGRRARGHRDQHGLDYEEQAVAGGDGGDRSRAEDADDLEVDEADGRVQEVADDGGPGERPDRSEAARAALRQAGTQKSGAPPVARKTIARCGTEPGGSATSPASAFPE